MRDGAMEDEGGWICFLMMVLEGDSCASDFDLPSVWEPDARAVCGSILPPSFSTCQLSNFPLPTTSSGRQPSRTPFRVTRTTPPSMVAASPQHSMDGSSMSFIYLFICPPFNAPACPQTQVSFVLYLLSPLPLIGFLTNFGRDTKGADFTMGVSEQEAGYTHLLSQSRSLEHMLAPGIASS